MTFVTIQYGELLFTAEVRRTNRRTLGIAVHPDGLVVVTAPLDADVDAIRHCLRRRARWIAAQRAYFADFHPRTTERRWLPGETHLYLGRQYRLRISNAAASSPTVHRASPFLLIDGVAFNDPAGIERAVRDWYRDQARAVIDRRIPHCVARFDRPLAPTTLTVRAMTSRWASMSSTGRLTVNPDLVRAPIDAIDYVLTHELAHTVVPDHGIRFMDLLDRVMPDHERRKRRLERTTA
jgi:hypothetical protein